MSLTTGLLAVTLFDDIFLKDAMALYGVTRCFKADLPRLVVGIEELAVAVVGCRRGTRGHAVNVPP